MAKERPRPGARGSAESAQCTAARPAHLRHIQPQPRHGSPSAAAGARTLSAARMTAFSPRSCSACSLASRAATRRASSAASLAPQPLQPTSTAPKQAPGSGHATSVAAAAAVAAAAEVRSATAA